MNSAQVSAVASRPRWPFVNHTSLKTCRVPCAVGKAMKRILLCLALCLAVLAGCASPYADADRFRAEANLPYQLASGDRLRVIVFGQDQLTNSYSIDGAGNLSMPLIGLVRAQSLTSGAGRRGDRTTAAPRLSARSQGLGRSRGLPAVFRARRGHGGGPVPLCQRPDGAERHRHRGRIYAARLPGVGRLDPRRRRAVDHSFRSVNLPGEARRHDNGSGALLLIYSPPRRFAAAAPRRPVESVITEKLRIIHVLRAPARRPVSPCHRPRLGAGGAWS